MFIIFSFFGFPFLFLFFYFLRPDPPPATRYPSPATRHPSTRYPSPVTRHPRKSPAVPGTDESDNGILSILKMGGGVGGGEGLVLNTSSSMQIKQFLLLLSTHLSVLRRLETIIHKQTLPSSPEVLGDFDGRVLLEVNGLLPSFEPEIKRQISDNLNNLFCSGYVSYCGTKRMRATTASWASLRWGVGGRGGVNLEHKFVNADQTISTIAFDALVSTETIRNYHT